LCTQSRVTTAAPRLASQTWREALMAASPKRFGSMVRVVFSMMMSFRWGCTVSRRSANGTNVSGSSRANTLKCPRVASPKRPLTRAHTPQAALVRELARATGLHELRLADDDRARALGRLASWQANRMANTYADLASQGRYAHAISVFPTGLYGGSDFRQS